MLAQVQLIQKFSEKGNGEVTECCAMLEGIEQITDILEIWQ